MDPTPISFGWSDVIKLSVSAGIITTIINQGVGWILDWRKDKTSLERDGRYLALRLAVTLEQFAIECAESINDNEMFSEHRGHAGKPHSTLPKLAEYPTDADWKALAPALSARTLALRNELVLGHRVIEFWYDVDPECVPEECNEQAGKCGLRAWQIAIQLRAQYKLPDFDREIAWDFPKVLQQYHDRSMERLRAVRARELVEASTG